MFYLDTSAIVKLVFAEPESAALETYLGADPVAVSALSRTELRRVALRISPDQMAACDDLLESCFEVTITPAILDEAGIAEPASLRSLDALHFVCAQRLGPELSGLVAYDDRLLAAGEAAGLPVANPS